MYQDGIRYDEGKLLKSQLADYTYLVIPGVGTLRRETVYGPERNVWFVYRGKPIEGEYYLEITDPRLPEECKLCEERLAQGWRWQPCVNFAVNGGNGAALEFVKPGGQP